MTSLPNRTFTDRGSLSVSVSGWRGRWAVKTGYLRVPTRRSESELYNSNLLDTQVLSPYTRTSVISTNLAHLDRGVPNGTRRDRANYGSGFQPTDLESDPDSILGFEGQEVPVLQREVPVAPQLEASGLSTRSLRSNGNVSGVAAAAAAATRDLRRLVQCPVSSLQTLSTPQTLTRFTTSSFQDSQHPRTVTARAAAQAGSWGSWERCPGPPGKECQ